MVSTVYWSTNVWCQHMIKVNLPFSISVCSKLVYTPVGFYAAEWVVIQAITLFV